MRRRPAPRSRRNPAARRATTETLYRSVSPEEMVDIVRTGRITGRGNTFSGDDRTSLVFFGAAGARDVQHNGEDTTRQVSTSPAFVARFQSLRADAARANAEHRHFERYLGDYGYNVPRAESARFTAWRKLQDRNHKAHKKILDAMYVAVAKARAAHRAKYGATSFVLELHDVPGGILYTAPDSRHQTDEVGFQRAPGVPADAIAWVSVVLDGKVAHRLPYDKFLRLFAPKIRR